MPLHGDRLRNVHFFVSGKCIVSPQQARSKIQPFLRNVRFFASGMYTFSPQKAPSKITPLLTPSRSARIRGLRCPCAGIRAERPCARSLSRMDLDTSTQIRLHNVFWIVLWVDPAVLQCVLGSSLNITTYMYPEHPQLPIQQKLPKAF